jgi:hypothetical protein
VKQTQKGIATSFTAWFRVRQFVKGCFSVLSQSFSEPLKPKEKDVETPSYGIESQPRAKARGYLNLVDFFRRQPPVVDKLTR